MTIVIPKTSTASPKAIARLQERFGQLPADYINFLMKCDGAKLPDNVLAGTNQDIGVRRFVPAAQIISLSKRIAGLAKSLIPIAEAAVGDYVCMGSQDHKNYYWDHEINGGEDLSEVKVIRQSFPDFLAGREPFRWEDVKHKPKVVSSWIDPNFKPKF
jgi:SMI1 / KNR4 family (SUKH-1)